MSTPPVRREYDPDVDRPVRHPGLISGMPEGIYHADPTAAGSLSVHSSAPLVAPGGVPSDYVDAVTHPRGPSAAMEVGTAFHSLLLGTGAVPVLCDYDSWRTKAAQERRREVRESGGVPLLPADYAMVHSMVGAVHQDPRIAPFVQGGVVEQSGFVQDPDTGVWLRGRADILHIGDTTLHIVDPKTTESLRDGDISRDMARFGYHRQAAWYVDLFGVLTGTPTRGVEFHFLFVRKSAPSRARVVALDPADVAEGRRLNRAAIARYAQCMEQGEFPTYRAVSVVRLPPWARGTTDTDTDTDTDPFDDTDQWS